MCEKYVFKGNMLAVVGRIQTRSYDAQDGSKRYVTEVVADEIQFLSSPSSTPQRQDNSYRSSAQPNDKFGVPMDGFEEIDDLNLPF